MRKGYSYPETSAQLQVPGSWGILYFPLTMATPPNTRQVPLRICYNRGSGWEQQRNSSLSHPSHLQRIWNGRWQMVSFTSVCPLWPDMVKSLCTALWGSVPGSLGGTTSCLSCQMEKKYAINPMRIWIQFAGYIETTNKQLRESMRLKHMSGNPSLLYTPCFRQPGCRRTYLVLGYISFFLRWRKWSGKPCLISPDFNIFE